MKVMVLTGHDWALLNYRGPLLRALVTAGHEAVAAAPPENPTVVTALKNMGVGFVPVPITRAGLNPFADLRTVWALRRMLQRERPAVLLSHAVKSVIYGSIAAKFAGVPHIHCLIAGLGSAFNTPGLKGRLLKTVATQLYRLAFTCCDTVFVQNSEIGEMFIRQGVVPARKVVVVPGSGVDTDHFGLAPLPEGPPVFLFVGRLLRDKGIREFIAAAKLVKARLPEARFVVVGDIDPNPTSVSAAEIESWRSQGVVEHHGFAHDVRPLLHRCSVFVLPSYHEGVPRSTLEAMAVGRPIVTTDVIGCRETIRNAGPDDTVAAGTKRGRNGFLVPVGTVEPLAAAMERLARDRVMALAMARESRMIAETVFDVRLVNQVMLTAMKLMPAEEPGGPTRLSPCAE